MRKLLTFVISFLLGAIFLVGLFNYVVDWNVFSENLAKISVGEWVLVLVFVTLPFVFAVLRWREILKALGIDVSIKDLFYYRLSAFSITYLIPIAALWADLFRAQISKKDFPKSIASVLIDRVFSIVFYALVITGGVIVFFVQSQTFSVDLFYVYLVALLFSLLSLGVILLFLFKPGAFEKVGLLHLLLNSFAKKGLVEEAGRDVSRFFKEVGKMAMFKISFLTVLNLAFSILFTFFILQALGYSLPTLSLWSLYSITTSSLETPISADLGSHDLASALAFKSLGIGREAGTVYALVFRGGKLFLTILGLFFLTKLKMGEDEE